MDFSLHYFNIESLKCKAHDLKQEENPFRLMFCPSAGSNERRSSGDSLTMETHRLYRTGYDYLLVLLRLIFFLPISVVKYLESFQNYC